MSVCGVCKLILGLVKHRKSSGEKFTQAQLYVSVLKLFQLHCVHAELPFPLEANVEVLLYNNQSWMWKEEGKI